MKRLLFVLILFNVQVSNAQNWNPFPVDQISFYQFENNGSQYIEKYNITQRTVDEQEYFFFKSKDRFLDSCYQNSDGHGDFVGFVGHSTDFSFDYFMVDDDNIYFYKFATKEQIGYTIQESKEWAFYIKPHCKLDESWETRYNKITCSELKIESVLGINDSIKVFTIGERDDQIILSKSFGLISIPKCFFSNPLNSGNIPENMKLVGFENTQVKKGLKQPAFGEYFNLKAGDKKYYSYYFIDNEWVGNGGMPVTVIEEITDVTRDENRVIYSTVNVMFDNSGEVAQTNRYTNEYSKYSLGLVLESSPMSFQVTNYHLNADLVNFDSLRMEIEGTDTIFYAKIRNTGMSMFNERGKCWVENITADYLDEALFSTRYGWLGNSTMKLVGGEINGKTFGNTSIIVNTAIDDLIIETLEIYPNPVKTEISICDNRLMIKSIEIKNVSGYVVIKEDYSSIIDIGALSKGVYFVDVFYENGEVITRKIVKK